MSFRSPRRFSPCATAFLLLIAGTPHVAAQQQSSRTRQATGAALVVPRANSDLRKHAIFVNRRGEAMRVAVESDTSPQVSAGKLMTDREYDVYLHEMMQALRARPRIPVLLYAHGGLVTLQGALENNTVMEKAITTEGEYYPIFVNWHASLPTTLGEHLCCVRQGERESWAPLTIPLAFFGGLANSVVEAIPSWGSQVGDGTVPLRRSPQSYDIVYDSLRREFGQPNQIRVSRGDVARLPPVVQRFGGLTVGSPFRAFGSPFVAGFGAPAWENMLRRIHLMFRADDERSTALAMAKQGTVDYRAPSGALGVLMDSLSTLVAEERGSRTITLIGHSMGAIVMNELLQRYPELPVSDIVYMAPASSVRDLETSVIPFMRENTSTRFTSLPCIRARTSANGHSERTSSPAAACSSGWTIT